MAFQADFNHEGHKVFLTQINADLLFVIPAKAGIHFAGEIRDTNITDPP